MRRTARRREPLLLLLAAPALTSHAGDLAGVALLCGNPKKLARLGMTPEFRRLSDQSGGRLPRQRRGRQRGRGCRVGARHVRVERGGRRPYLGSRSDHQRSNGRSSPGASRCWSRRNDGPTATPLCDEHGHAKVPPALGRRGRLGDHTKGPSDPLRHDYPGDGNRRLKSSRPDQPVHLRPHFGALCRLRRRLRPHLMVETLTIRPSATH